MGGHIKQSSLNCQTPTTTRYRSGFTMDFSNSATVDIILRSGGPKVVEFRAHRAIPVLSLSRSILCCFFSAPSVFGAGHQPTGHPL